MERLFDFSSITPVFFAHSLFPGVATTVGIFDIEDVIFIVSTLLFWLRGKPTSCHRIDHLRFAVVIARNDIVISKNLWILLS